MGFWSKLGKVAKIAAPFALDFIPGGQLAHLAMAAGLGAATSKGGVKSRLLGAGIGAGEQFGGHLLKGGGYNPVALGADEGVHAPLFGVGGGGGATTGRSVTNSSVVSTGGNVPGGDVVKDVVGGAAKEPGLASKLLHDPKTYYAALAMLQGNPNGQDARRAYKGVDADANVRSLLDASNSNYDRAVDQQKNRTNYHADYWNPQPVIAGSSQIGGGMDTTEAERLMAEHEKGRA